MIAGPDAIDRLIKDSSATGNVHRLASMCSKAHEDVVNSPERPVSERAHVLDDFLFDDRACRSKGMSGVFRMRASPSVAIAYAAVAQGLAAGPKTYTRGVRVCVEVSNQDHLPGGALSLVLDELSCSHGLAFLLALKVQLPMRKMVDE
jgi:hypothetical protein